MMKQMCKMLLCSAVLCSVVTSCRKSVITPEGTELGKELKTISGQLDNGFTYYVKENTYDTNKASLRLAVKAGSVLETEEERGLAHFLEHMVFRGTESYSDGEVIDYLESIGASFGADTNAYTSYDETVYMFEIPLDKKESLEKAISILSEFSMKATLSEEQLEIEKNVVLDELRLRTGNAQGRSMNKLLELLLQGTRYAERLPIGLESVVATCTPEKMRNFYKKWYRPENMAIIVVGDFSSDEVLSHIHNYFGSLPTSDHVEPIELPEINGFDEQFVNVYKDPESTNSFFILGNWMKNNPLLTTEDVKKDLIDTLVFGMTNRRLSIKSQEDSPPFQMAVIASVKWLHASTCFFQQCICWDEKPLQGLEALKIEYEKIRQQDFTSHELELALATQKNMLKLALENAHKHKNSEYAMQYIQHFMGKASALSFEENAQISGELLSEIKLCDVNARRNELFKKQGQMAVFIPSAKASEVSEEQMTAILTQDMVITPSEQAETKHIVDLMTEFKSGTVIEDTLFEKTGVKKWKLSNGMTVYLEKTPLKENLISVALKAPGGFSSYDASLYPSATASFTYLQKSGLAGLSSTQLTDALAGKHAHMMYMMGLGSRDVKMEVAVQDLDVAFKLLQALFTDRFYREEAWNQQMKAVDQMFELKDKNPDMRFYTDVAQFNYKNHYIVGEYNSQHMNRMEAEKILQDAFKDPSEYTIVVVGDYEEQQLKECLEKYLASIPASSEKFPQPVVTHFEFPEGINHRNLEYPALGKEGSIYWSCPIQEKKSEEGYEEFYQFELAKHVIQTRLLKKIRVEAGETYGIHCTVFFPFSPKTTSGTCSIIFSTSKETVESMKTLLLEEIQKIREVLPTTEEITAAQEIVKHHHLQALQTNKGRVDRILEQLDFSSEPDHFVAEKVYEITSEQLHDTMKRMLNVTNYNLHAKVLK